MPGSVGEHLHLWDVAIFLREVEAVSDDELRLDREPDVVRGERHFSRFWFVEKRGGLHGRSTAALDVAEDFAHRKAAIDDVFHDQDRAAAHVELRLLQNGHDTRRILLRSVGRNLDKVQSDIELDVADEIGTEEDRALEDAESDEVRPGKIGTDLLPHFGDTTVDLLTAD